MKLTKKTDYGIRVLIYLQMADTQIKIKDLANELELSKNHLSVVVNRLSELGYVSTVSGPYGGISINSNAKKRKLSQLFKEMENFDIVECFNAETNTCNLTPKCKLKHILSKANKAFINELSQFTIEDLV